MTRQCWLNHASKTAIFWSPKVASTSVTNIFARDILGFTAKAMREDGDSVRSYMRKWGYELEYHQAYQLLKNPEYRSIVLLREPYERLASVFVEKFVFHSAGRPMDSFEALDPFSRKAYMQIKHVSRRIASRSYEGVSFSEFLDYIISNIDLCEARGEPKLNYHWNTQVPFMFDRASFEYDFVYSLPNFNRFLAQLGDLTGCSIRPGHYKKGATRVGANGGESDAPLLLSVSSLELCKGYGQLDLDSFYNSEYASEVKRCFRPDYSYLEAAA